ncbi:hypothetical protein MMC27_004269 [Xylographa pallens]|nr:hypothetical protein [Xylographa pallens]
MAEAVGLVASVVGLAAFGAKLSLTLYEYGDTIVHARKQIDSIANEVTLCSSVLHHVGAVLESEKATYSPALVVTTKRIIQECKDLFHEIRSKVKHRKRQSGKGIRRVKWLFDKPRAKELTAELEGLKSTLMLMVQTVTLATKASKSEDKSEQDVDGIKKELELLKSLIISNHHTILNLQEVEMEAAHSLGPVPPYSGRPPVDHLYSPGASYYDTPIQPDFASGPTYQDQASSSRGITTQVTPRTRPSYERAAEEDDAHHVRNPEKLGNQRNIVSGGSKNAPWRDSPVVMLTAERDPEDKNDMNEPETGPPFVSPDHRGTVNYPPQSNLLTAPPLALHDNSRPPSHVPSTRPNRRSTSRLLIQEVPSGYPSGYYVMPSVKGLITEGGHQSTDRPPSNAKQDTTSTVQLLLDKWTKVGSSYVTALIDEIPQGSESEKAGRPGRRSHRDTSRRQTSANTREDYSTSDSDSGSDDDWDRPSGYATIGDDSDVDNGRPRRSNDRPGDSYPQRPGNRRGESYERLPGARRYDMPRYRDASNIYDDADFGAYRPPPHPVERPGVYTPYQSQPWKNQGSIGNEELRILEGRLDSQERYFSLLIEKLKVDMKLENLDQRKAVELEAEKQALLKEVKYRAAETEMVATEKAAAEREANKQATIQETRHRAVEMEKAAAEAAAAERYQSELIFEAWKPSSGRKLPGDEHDEYDILNLIAKKDRGGIVWSRGNDARLSSFVGPKKFLTIQFLPPSHLQAGEELDQYTIIGKEWVRREVLELFKHPFVEKEATFYEVSRPLTFPQVESLVRISLQLRKDSYTQTARSLMAERTSQLSSMSNDDDEVLHFSSATASPPSPDHLNDVYHEKPKQPPNTSARKDKDKDRTRHTAGSSREQGRERRKARTSSTTSRNQNLY